MPQVSSMRRQRSANGSMKCMRRSSILENFEVITDNPIPEVPEFGARVRVCYAGACYDENDKAALMHARRKLRGFQDTSLFPGFEVSGVVDELSPDISNKKPEFHEGDRIIVYPSDEKLVHSGYSEFIPIKNVDDLIKIPPTVSLEKACMLPCGALRAYSAIDMVKPFFLDKLKHSNGPVNVLIIGASGLGLWTLALSRHLLAENNSKVRLSVADGKVENLMVAKELGCNDIVHWDESIYEAQILDRTRSSCSNGADVVVDFVCSPRSVKRSLKVLNERGVLVVGGNGDCDMSVRIPTLSSHGQVIMGAQQGTREQLDELVHVVADDGVKCPPYRVFPLEEANRAFQCLSDATLAGRAILQVSPENDEYDKVFFD